MNIYRQKRRWKLMLFVAAVAIGAVSLWYTNNLMQKLSAEERKKIELWAKATEKLINADPMDDIGFIFEVQKNNETIPVLLVDTKDNIISFRNIDSMKMLEPVFRKNILEKFKNNDKDHFVIKTDEGIELNRIYYSDSLLLSQLQYYPYIQLGIIALFVFASYFAFSIARKVEQNHVWLGMSKETAHQLGTPISSLLAWLEVLKLETPGEKMITEIEKDVERLEKITQRFSKIGSKPVLKPTNIVNIISNTVEYIRVRSPETVNMTANFEDDIIANVPINKELFEWVIENVCKNAIDAVSGKGNILINVSQDNRNILIDITDDGKGMPKSQFRAIFQPGYTTKSRGWGLGLSLSKRIVEQYHNGKIFVKSSEVGVGTTIRIVIRKHSKHK